MHTISTNTAGLVNGLTLEVFAGYEKEIPSFSASYGFSIFVFNQTEDERFTIGFQNQLVQTNTQLTVGVEISYINKLPKPYSSCDFDLNDREFISKSLLLNSSEFLQMTNQNNKTYRQKNCFQNCFKNILLQSCGCIIGNMSKF